MTKTNQLIIMTVTALAIAASPAIAAEKTVAFISADNSLPFYKYGVDAAVEAGKALNVNVLTYSSKSDPSQELANVQDAITKGVNGILMYAVSLSSERAAIAQANRTGVPIFLEYGYAPSILKDTAGVMQMDAESSGKVLGDWIAKNVAQGDIAIVSGLLGRGEVELYVKGFREGIASNPKLKIVAEAPADWNRQKAMEVTSQILTAHPDVKAIFVNNEDMTVGASIAIERAGKGAVVKVVSMNGSPEAPSLIRAKKLAVTYANPPSVASVLALRLLLGVIDGKVAPGKYYDVPTLLVDAHNVDEIQRWDATPADIKAWLALPLPAPKQPPSE
jgi:ABC-type sugar transport system substrate-binding protein